MATRHVVVDGSNIATEGRTNPSLKQLREAVSSFEADHKGAKITVVVDATFEHRVDSKERRATELAEDRGEIISPPAGAIGRGDAFLLKIAQKTGATVLSNDSFQEFHDDHKWLFETGRLIGGKPVPGVGWIFTDRSPVRSRNGTSRSISQAAAAEERVMDRAIVAATKELVAEGTPAAKKDKSNEPINEPLVFIQFIAEHRIGTEVRGTVDRFTAHGAFVTVGNARCYIPLTGMGSPPPRSPRSVLTKGEKRSFMIKAVNAGRRDIELALPGVGRSKAEDKPKAETRTAESQSTTADSKETTAARRKTKSKTKPKSGPRVNKAAKAKKATRKTTKKSHKRPATKTTPRKKSSSRRNVAAGKKQTKKKVVKKVAKHSKPAAKKTSRNNSSAKRRNASTTRSTSRRATRSRKPAKRKRR